MADTGGPSIRIPPAQLKAIEGLASLNDSDFEAFYTALALVPEASRSSDIVAAVGQQIPEQAPRAREFVDAVMSVDVLRSSQSFDLDQTATAVAESADLTLTDGERVRLAERLKRALGVDAVWHLSKAYDLGTAYTQSLQKARILTDTRWIFGESVHERPPTALIAHSLELLTYDDSGKQQYSYISLDSADLAGLKSQVERAIDKEATIRSLLEDSKVAVHHLENQ
jgi:hypothetical protein